jgi:hypothetical protein
VTGAERLPDRLSELLAGKAAGDLTRDEGRELALLRRAAPPADRPDLLAVGGLLQLAFLKSDRGGARRRMPRRLEDRLLAQAEAWQAQPAAAVTNIAGARRRRPAGVDAESPAAAPDRFRGWWAAAAGWAVAAMLAWNLMQVPGRGPAPAGALPPAALRAALLRTGGDVQTVRWGASEAPGYAGVQGEVVWSDSRQEGYLRLAGVPPNDRQRQQYQLWIVDPERDSHPVDGGVFDIPSTGEVIVPIQARLHVEHPKAFAITLERAGGVVVSGGPLLLVASARI